jgi:phosphonatase-like hydrolase
MKFDAVLFDMIGTTVKEDDPETIMNCFEEAFREQGIDMDAELLRRHRGKDKLQMIGMLVAGRDDAGVVTREIYQSFKNNLQSQIGNFSTASGAFELFDYLKTEGVKIGIGTGMERDLFNAIALHLKWNLGVFDYIGIGPEIGKSRPHPEMILKMLAKCNVQPGAFLKVGDTVADVEEGKNAGVSTAAILSGTQSPEALSNAKPDYMIHRLEELKKIVSNK